MARRRGIPAERLPATPDEHRYSLAAAAGGVAVWDWNLATNDLFVDPVLRVMLGYDDAPSSDSMLGWARLVHPDDREMLLREIQNCVHAHSSRFEIEHRMLHHSGEHRWFMTRGSTIRNENGNPVRALGTTTDVSERKLAQLAVRESEERFRQLAENTPQIFWLMPTDMTRLLYISPAYEEITGHPCAELYTNPQSWMDAVHPDDRERVLHAVAERRTGTRLGQTYMEYRYLRPDGTVRWMQAVIIPILDEFGVPYRISGIAEDVTERKRNEELLRRAREDLAAKVEHRTMELTATVRLLEQEIAERTRVEKALRQSEFRFRRLFESNIIGAMIADVHGQITEANDALLELTGYSKADLPLRWDRMTPPEWNAVDAMKLEQIQREGVASPYEKEYLRKDGTRIPIYLGAALLDNESGTCIAFVIDLTARKQAEQQLRDSEMRFRRLFESNIIGAMIADVHGVIYHVNDAILKITGYSREELPLRWDTITPPEWRYTDERAIVQLMRDGFAPPWEKEYFRKDGSRVPILLGVAMLDGDECIAFILDLTDLKAAEEEIRGLNAQLEQASRLSMMGETVAALAHEVHQPLAAMANYANGTIRRLNQRQVPVAEIIDRLHQISAESVRAAEVLRRVRQFLQLRESKHEEMHLNTIVQDALKLARFDRDEHHVEIIFQPADDLPMLSVDPIQITQVTLNLVLNGIQAMGDQKNRDRRITVETRPGDDGFVEVSVADTGPGIPVEAQSKIFEQFYTTKSEGLGMGLSISRSIVEAHGGRLWYETSRGGGAVFRFTLPIRRLQPVRTSNDTGESEIAANVASPAGDDA